MEIDSSSGLINVNGCDDLYYRYKMEPLYVINTEAKGGTTIIRNLQCVAESIYRTPSDIKSFYSKKLGLTARIKNEELCIPGRFSKETLQQLLQTYIDSNVLCPKCQCPETHITKTNSYRCHACGNLMVQSG